MLKGEGGSPRRPLVRDGEGKRGLDFHLWEEARVNNETKGSDLSVTLYSGK